MTDLTLLLALTGRGDLPFELLHGEPLYLHALRALNEAFPGECLVSVPAGQSGRIADQVSAAELSADVVDGDAWWSRLDPDAGRDLLVHDSLCPLTSAAFLRDLAYGGLADAATDCSRVAFRPVTDTVKRVVDGRIVGTIDREGLAAVTSPVLLRASVLVGAVARGEVPPLADLAALVGWLRERGTVELVRAPSLARRVDDPSAVNLLECVDEMSRRTRM
ncbi:2-C-methyl-D-erythritol 4-phosphate cytidylyltransferase [Nocardioides sp.]|uniref:2-C-methyl-D-erythritol 4-phosphate cytidylyltransferase n=1 Tax=Nocardioides sp. TaxID=35761 RepID=UPI003D114008